jgi:hypothetical protein
VNQLVLGAGEVGEALATLMGCDLRDVEDPGDLAETYQMLHIAYPWQIENFVQTTKDYAEQYSAEYVVVHSTVPVGTCDPHSWVHSPVRGKHPRMLDGLHNFDKHYGGVHAAEVAGILEWWFPNRHIHEQAATTELGKLLELTAYGMEIVLEKYAWRMCERLDVPFDEAYTVMSETYNEGWAYLGHSEYVKPILQHVEGPLGGHCVVAGAELLNKSYRNLISEVVMAVQKELEAS